MFPDFLPTQVNHLTEASSIEFAKQIQQHSILTPLSPLKIPTAYVQAGNGGTPIVLLHGFDSSLLEFRRLFPLLAQQQTTWAVDLLGFGFTERPIDLNFSSTQIRTHLYYFWKTLIEQPIILVGASMGGAVAIDFTLNYPEIVSKLILIDSAGLTNPPAIGKFMFSPLDYFAAEFLRNPKIRQNISRSAYYDKSYASLDAQICAALHLQSVNWHQALIKFTKSGGYGSFATQLNQLEQPTLIIWGENDRILGTKDAPRFKQLLPNSELVWIPNCGHVPHLEQPKITAEAIANFV
ncbi:alpha/beta hydrolase fold protein [Stanieria cyanosphaera PCC 7437]|uniref:Alpha/beta hydrolase fold protein n=1 Tax=Stanieria cyanosphaera (strain ATCC 29371 / PCC 7437) TaxID=111780 RepID=K9XYB9_STAC7|nr:alpha/beta hydrolase [Stanieria cyanosphaera]AFZ37585.1 alpha/beta hydrolase fold protein [Stanieria cyanosphaera PCC 7437]